MRIDFVERLLPEMTYYLSCRTFALPTMHYVPVLHIIYH